MDISIVIVNRNTKALLLKCLDSIINTVKGLEFEVWLIDNGSSDGSPEAALEVFPDINLIKNTENLGFSAANNQAFRKINGRYAFLLNSDAFLTEDAAAELFKFMENTPDAAMACGQLLYLDGNKQNSFARFPTPFTLLLGDGLYQILFPLSHPVKRQNFEKPVQVDSCIGACMIVRKNAMNQVGLLDERYFFFMEETDWAKSMSEQGWKAYFVPWVKVYHGQGKSIGGNAYSRIMFYRSRYEYFKKWYPDSMFLVYSSLLIRVIANTILNGFGTLLTFGAVASFKHKFKVNGTILLWHLKACRY